MRAIILITALTLTGCELTPTYQPFDLAVNENELLNKAYLSSHTTKYGTNISITERDYENLPFEINVVAEKSYDKVTGIQSVNFWDNKGKGELKIEAQCTNYNGISVKLNFMDIRNFNMEGSRSKGKLVSYTGTEVFTNNLSQKLNKNDELFKFLTNDNNKGPAKIYLEDGREFKTTIRPNALLLFVLKGEQYCTSLFER